MAAGPQRAFKRAEKHSSVMHQGRGYRDPGARWLAEAESGRRRGATGAPGAPRPWGARPSTGVGSKRAWMSRSWDKPHVPPVPRGCRAVPTAAPPNHTGAARLCAHVAGGVGLKLSDPRADALAPHSWAHGKRPKPPHVRRPQTHEQPDRDGPACKVGTTEAKDHPT